jgi:hypothetical protein
MYTTGLGAQRPILALNMTNPKTTTAAVTEGDAAFSFSNATNVIDVGHHIFLSDASDHKNQYLGLCLTSSATGITTAHAAQESTGASSKVWSPTSYAYFEWGIAERGGMAHTYEPGTALAVTRGGIGYPQKSADATEWVRLQLGQAMPTDYELLRAFVATSLSSGTSKCSLAFWDATKGKARVVEVYVEPVALTEIKEGPYLVSFGFSVLVQAEDTYTAA